MDTIFAPATPSGESALGIIRISGEHSLQILMEACKISNVEPRKAKLADYYSVNAEHIDQILVTYFEQNRSYTGEHSLEISCHGNPLIINLLCDDLLDRGCRFAKPGEFTQLAFLNGKIDLSQAESVAQIISSKSKQAMHAAQRNLRGDLSKLFTGIQDQILSIQAIIEAYIDFPEDDIGSPDHDVLTQKIDPIIKKIEHLCEQGVKLQIFEKNIRIVLIGPPNAGKSSLFNKIIGSDRALVHEKAGTTRDFIEKEIVLGKHKITLVDTAGIHQTSNAVEQVGVQLSYQQTQHADVLLCIMDGSVPYPTEFFNSISNISKNVPLLLVLNKSDLNLINNDLPIKCQQTFHVSCVTEEGIDVLTKSILATINQSFTEDMEDHVYIGKRHIKLLNDFNYHILKFKEEVIQKNGYELLSETLLSARDVLDELIGYKTNEDMLDKLFGSFCIGK